MPEAKLDIGFVELEPGGGVPNDPNDPEEDDDPNDPGADVDPNDPEEKEDDEEGIPKLDEESDSFLPPPPPSLEKGLLKGLFFSFLFWV